MKILRFKLFENKDINYIRQCFVDAFEEIESSAPRKVDINVRIYDAQIDSGWDLMPDVVIDIFNINKSYLYSGTNDITNTFVYDDIFFKLLNSKIEYIDQLGDISFIGVDYETNHKLNIDVKKHSFKSRGSDIWVYKSENLIIPSKLEKYPVNFTYIFRLKLYFRFDIPE